MRYVFIILVMFCFSCKQDGKQEVVERYLVHVPNKEVQSAVEIPVYDFNELEPLLHKTDDKIYVVNFWATWCGPCVKELPYFEKLGEVYKNKQVEVILVSLDFSSAYETELKPFVLKHKLKSKVVALHDTDANTWIPKVDENWSGAIPATIIYSKDKRMFFEQSFTYESLQSEVSKFLN